MRTKRAFSLAPRRGPSRSGDRPGRGRRRTKTRRGLVPAETAPAGAERNPPPGEGPKKSMDFRAWGESGQRMGLPPPKRGLRGGAVGQRPRFKGIRHTYFAYFLFPISFNSLAILLPAETSFSSSVRKTSNSSPFFTILSWIAFNSYFKFNFSVCYIVY